jgi:nucleotide-binding universal stress UspA family protein
MVSAMETIVVGTDGSAAAQAAVRWAAKVARCEGARVHLVTAFPDRPLFEEMITGSVIATPIDFLPAAEALLEAAAEVVEQAGLQVERHAIPGDPASAIIEVARTQDADLVVVGDRGLTRVERLLLGSVADKLAHHSPCSVTIVRQDSSSTRSATESTTREGR